MARGQEPKWTLGDPTKYIEPEHKYLKYNGLGIKRFFPINPEIPSIDGNNPGHWEKVHSYMTTNYAREVLAAYLSVPRTRDVQEKPRFYRVSTYHQRKRGL